MAIDVDVDVAAVVRMLRYLEREYRGLRIGAGDEPGRIFKDGKWRLESQLGRALSMAYVAGLLPLPIASDIAAVERDVEAHGISLIGAVHLSLVPHIVGYCDVKSVDDDGEPGGEHRFLAPGAIELVWPEIFGGVWLSDDTKLASYSLSRPIFDGAWLGDADGVDDPAIIAAVLGLYAEACRLLADWIEENPTGSDARGHYLNVTMRCNSAADVRTRLLMLANQIVIFKDEDPGLYQMFQQMDYPEPGPDRSLDPMAAALSAIVGSEFVSVLNMAANAKATDRATAIISGRLAKDQTLYDWTADDWVNDLGMAKKTIVGCDAWKSILGWREANKVSKKTRK